MRRYLVIANQTLGSQALADVVAERLSKGPCTFHVLVPATPPHDQASWTEGHAHHVASQRLDEGLERFRALGAEASGEVGDASPVRAVGDVVREGVGFDEILLSTLPPGPSRWLRQDLVHRMGRTWRVPITHVVAHTADH